MIKYAYIALAFTLIALIKWYGYNQYQAGENSMELFWQKRLSEQVVDARKVEKARHTLINEALQVRFDETTAINNTLNSDLSELRNRPERVSRDTRAECTGATGAELSGRDAEAFTRHASRADRLRSALKICYSYSDSLQVTD